MIDSLALFESLKTADLPDRQARAIAQAIGSAFADDEAQRTKALATMVDTAKLDAEVHRVETSLKQDIFELRAEMRAGLAQLRSDFRNDTAQLETKLAKTESKMIRWMFIFWIGQVAAMKFLR
jgi:hypothetical protein